MLTRSLQLDGLDPHQADAVPWLIERPKAMLAWEMGVGKTAPLVRAWELTAEQGPLLVMCLASARENWRREVLKYALDQDWRPRVQAIYEANDRIDRKADVVVCNYHKLLNPLIANKLRTRRWGAIVLDEAHALKTSGAQRTEIVYGGGRHQKALIGATDRVWLATGTPMPNHPGELFTHAAALWPDRMMYRDHVMEEWEFQAAFCEIKPTQYGMQIVGGRNLDELRQRLEPVWSRLRRKDVLNLPPCQVISWPLDAEIATSGTRRLPNLPMLLGSLTERYGPPEQIDRFDEATLDAYLAAIDSELMALATIRRETSILKAVLVALTVDEELDGTAHKTVIFAFHREAINTVAKALARYKPAVIHGDVPAGQRQAEIDRFQIDPNCRVFIGQITAAGSSINLQEASSDVVFVEASWSPGDNEQAWARVYRRGQENPVRVRFAFLPGTIDEAVQRALARKSAMIAQV